MQRFASGPFQAHWAPRRPAAFWAPYSIFQMVAKSTGLRALCSAALSLPVTKPGEKANSRCPHPALRGDVRPEELMVGAPHMLGTQGPRSQLLCTHIPGDCPRGTDEVWCYQLGSGGCGTKGGMPVLRDGGLGARGLARQSPRPPSLVQRQGRGEACPEMGPQASPSTASRYAGWAQPTPGCPLLGVPFRGRHPICSRILGGPSFLGLLLGLPEHVDLRASG